MDATSIKKQDSWKMFDSIAGSYDVLNSILSAGILRYWRRVLCDKLPIGNDLHCCDCATGTGEVMFSMMKKRHFDITQIHGLDLSKNMMAIGEQEKKQKPYHKKIHFHHASALDIPFEDNRFDVVTMAFGIRNVEDPQQCLNELYRITKPGGTVLIMEFSLPKQTLIKHAYLFYFRKILPFIAGVISGNREAYQYLNDTVEAFPYGNTFAEMMNKEGFQTTLKPLTFGIATLYCGKKHA